MVFLEGGDGEGGGNKQHPDNAPVNSLQTQNYMKSLWIFSRESFYYLTQFRD